MCWRLIFLLLTLLVLLLAAGGCTTFAAPNVEVAEAAAVSRTDEAQRLDIALHLQNPRDQPLDLREARYTFYLDGKVVYRGRWATQVTLSGDGERRVTLPAVAPARPADTGKWRVEGELVYLVPSRLAEILLDSGWWEPTVSFAGSGQLGR